MGNRIVNYLKTDNVFKGVLFIVLVVLSIVFFRACDKKKITQLTNEELTKDEKQAIIIDANGNVTNINKDGTKTIVNVTHGVRDVRVSVDKNNTLHLILRDKGLIHEVGIGIQQTGNFRGILDLQWFFYHEWGVNSGISFSTQRGDQLRVYTGVSYTLPWEGLSNTSVLLTYDTKREVGFGLRVRF